MFRFHVVQAAFGDALLLEYGSAEAARFILIDGGPSGTFERHLRSVLEAVTPRTATLDLAVLSHVDNDHIIGMLDYFAELQAGTDALPRPAALWHNAFADTLDPDTVIAPRLQALVTASRSSAMPASYSAVNGIGEGRSLRVRALAADVPVNPGVPNGLVSPETLPDPVRFENLALRVVGPLRANLERLRQEWLEWLEEHEDGIGRDDVTVLANSDRSVPNLSSIMLLAEADGGTILLPGDGRGDHLLDGLEHAGLLPPNGSLHVGVLKLPHHGSSRNVTQRFFDRVTADIYVASADGRYGNPDYDTLHWIVESARAGGRSVEVVATNPAPAVRQLKAKHPPSTSGYRLTVLPPSKHAHIITLTE
jgi:beta-lactamase superfamily II metal-dependent hydrolase